MPGRAYLFALMSTAVIGCNAGIGDPHDNGADAGAGGNQGGADASPDSPDADTACAPSDMFTYYRDQDGDGFGDPNAPLSSCDEPGGYVGNADDCNDGEMSVNPLALEMCGDKLDNDCVGGDPCVLSLLGHWDFDELGGTVAGDASGNNHPGALRNGAAFVGDSTVQFDGVDDFVEIGHDSSFAVANGTITLWFYAGDPTERQGLWSKDSSGLDDGGHLSIFVEDGSVIARMQSTTDSYYAQSPTVTANAWHHVAFTFGSGGMRIYVDGVPYGSDGYTGGMQANAEPIAVGTLTINSDDLVVTPTTYPMAGRIADVRAYDRSLSATEIADSYGLTSP